MHRVVAHAAFVLAGILMVLVPTPATAPVHDVAAEGIDSTACGTQAAPCRWIELAVAGNTITADGAEFGQATRGFTVRSAWVAASGVEIQGHRVSLGLNCGLTLWTEATLNAENNDRGSTNGPGGDPCLQGSGRVDTVPLQTREVVLDIRTGR